MFKLLKRFAPLLAFLFVVSLFIQPTTSSADNTSVGKNDLSKETYNQLIDEGFLPKELTYDDWVKISDESLFDELDKEIPMPNRVYGSETSGFTLKHGDILISNGTSSKGLTGHVGIAIGSDQILHIAGPGKHPVVVSVATWQKQYGLVKGQIDGRTNTKVYRISSTGKAGSANGWAKNAYVGKKYEYGTGGKLTSLNPTYCSKIVWQAYNYVGAVNKPDYVIVMPYQLPNLFKSGEGIKGIGIL